MSLNQRLDRLEQAVNPNEKLPAILIFCEGDKFWLNDANTGRRYITQDEYEQYEIKADVTLIRIVRDSKIGKEAVR